MYKKKTKKKTIQNKATWYKYIAIYLLLFCYQLSNQLDKKPSSKLRLKNQGINPLTPKHRRMTHGEGFYSGIF